MWLVHAFISLPKPKQALLALSPSFSLSSLRSVSSLQAKQRAQRARLYRGSIETTSSRAFAHPSFPQQQRQPPPDNQKKIKGRRGTEPPRVVHLNNPRLLSWCRQPRLATNQPNQLATQLHFLHSFLRSSSTLTLRVNVEARGHRVVLAAHPQFD